MMLFKQQLLIAIIVIVTNFIPLIYSKSLVNGNYKDFCDETYQENSSIVLRGYQLLLSADEESSSSSSSNLINSSKEENSSSNTKYLLINDANDFNDCVKKCCINEFKCDSAFFNHSSNVCLHLICDQDNSPTSTTADQCPLMRQDDQQQTSLIKIRSPKKRKSPIKYRNELNRKQLVDQYGLIVEEEQKSTSNLVLKGKYFGSQKMNNTQSSKSNMLTVVVDKNPILQLPNDSITINAYVQPPSNQYIYKWTVVSRPLSSNQQDSGSLEEQNTDSLKLNKLIEGTYIFNVTVSLPSNPNLVLGRESVNITVLPPKRINKPPQAIIQPSNSTVQLPKQEIVLDGSQSIDDDKIVSYKWSLVKSPIGFELPSNNNELETATLQLKNLIAGSYIFKLTVTDSNQQTDEQTAELTVLKEKDYPPTAVITQDKTIMFLPINSVTLMGNQSTDDKKIVSYEWTVMDENGSNKQINNMDMSGTKTPFLQLSNLKIGVYKINLKVTDSSNQSATAETHVFVKPEIDIKPEAIIKMKPENGKVYMPLKDDVVLDGTNSIDVSKGIIKWSWTQLDGPRASRIVNPNSNKTNLLNLIPGQYTFLLEIMNSKNLTSNATTTIEVFQNQNDKPIANAGGNQTVAEDSIVILNGSKSHDDLIDLKYSWTREKQSLAIGDIIEQSDKKQILKLKNLIHGRYVFKLTVEDNQGAKSDDIAIIDVKEPANIKQIVEILLKVNYKQFRHEQEIALLKKLEILLSANIDETIQLSDIKLLPIYDSQLTLLRFSVQVMINSKLVNLSATEVVKRLRLRLRNDKSLMDPEVLSIKTAICQNSCSGHGVCDEQSKECICNAFWMNNFLRTNFGDTIENCDWSVLYFILFSSFAFLFVCTVLWSFLCFFVRRRTMRLNFSKIKPKIRLKKRSKPRQTSRYTLLKQQNSNGFGGAMNNKIIDNELSDDSDSDIEHRNKLKTNIETKIKIKNGNSKSNYKDSSSESEIIEYDFNSISRRGYS